MSFYHGVSTSERNTSVATPVVASCGISFIVGTAPVHAGGGKVNIPVLAYNYAEAVTALGYSDDWTKYTLCEAIYSQFQNYGTAPVIFLNVLDPATMKNVVAAADMEVTNKQVKLSIDAIATSVVVKAAGGEGAAKVKDTDYALFYDGEYLVIELLSGGSIYTAEEINVAYDAVDASDVTATHIVGGYNANTHAATGLECVNQVLPMFGIVPDLLLAPGWSHDSTVAAALATKAAGINNLFPAKALIDADTAAGTGAVYYSDVAAWKASKNINDKAQILCWPMSKLGDKVIHLSTQLAGIMATVDTRNGGCPYESPSNEGMKADSLVLADGTEVLLDLTAANALNAQGVFTGLNFLNGFTSWGNETACFPANTDVKDYFICVSRVFGWVASTVIKTYWSRVDSPTNKRLIGTIVDSLNIWLNGLTAEEKLLGGRIEFVEADNPVTSLMAGKIKFKIYLTPPVPAREIAFDLEYDVNYLSALFAT